MRHRVESVARGDGKAREGLFIAVLRPPDQFGIHVFRQMGRPVDPGRSYGMGSPDERATQSLSPRLQRAVMLRVCRSGPGVAT